MITFCQKAVTDKTLKLIKDFQPGSWCYIENPTESEIEYLVDKLPLDPGLIKDALDPLEVPRVETEDNVVYIFTRVPIRDNGKVVTVPLLVAIGKNFFLTVAPRKFPFLEKFLDGKVNFTTTQKTRLFLQIFSEINQEYHNFLTKISREVRGISIQLERIENRDIIQFVNFEEILNDFMAALVPTNNLLQKFLSGKFLRLYERDEDLTEDLLLSNGQSIDLCKANLNTISNIREAYSTIMTNNLNRVIKLFTSLTVVLTIPTMIASIYGMNVALPGDQSPLAFLVIMAAIISISAILVVVFLRNRWL